MIDTLAVFGDQVTTVAREVGIEGKLGGQARVPGAAGIWRDLTDKRQSARRQSHHAGTLDRGSIDRQMTKGDLTRSISVEVQGELAALKDNINEMILNLKETPARTPNRTG